MEELKYQRVILDVAIPKTYQAASKNIDTGDITYKDIDQTRLDHIEELLAYDYHGLILLSASDSDLHLKQTETLESTIGEFISYAEQAPSVLDVGIFKGGKERIEQLQNMYSQAAQAAKKVVDDIEKSFNQERIDNIKEN